MSLSRNKGPCIHVTVYPLNLTKCATLDRCLLSVSHGNGDNASIKQAHIAISMQKKKRFTAQLLTAHLSVHPCCSAYYMFLQRVGCERPQKLKNARPRNAIKLMNNKGSVSECAAVSAADSEQMTTTGAESFEGKLISHCCCFLCHPLNMNATITPLCIAAFSYSQASLKLEGILTSLWDDTHIICCIVNMLLILQVHASTRGSITAHSSLKDSPQKQS